MKRFAILGIAVLALSVLGPIEPLATAQAKGLPKITINHKGKIKSVSIAALPAHLAHGDSIVDAPGPECPPNCPF